MLSRDKSCISQSLLSSENIASIIPLSFHALKRSCTVDFAPYVSGSSFHCAPVCPIHSAPFNTFRFDVLHGLPGFPVFSEGSMYFIRSHCSSLMSYVLVAIFITRLNILTDIVQFYNYRICSNRQTNPKQPKIAHSIHFPRKIRPVIIRYNIYFTVSTYGITVGTYGKQKFFKLKFSYHFYALFKKNIIFLLV